MNPYAIALFTLFSLGSAAHSETLTLATYYPSPVGVYTNLTVTSTTVLAKNGGGVNVGSAGAPSDLDVSGKAKMGGVVVPGNFSSDPTDAASKVEGAIYYNTTDKKHRVYQNGAWADMAGTVMKGTLAGHCTERLRSGGQGIFDQTGIAYSPAAVAHVDIILLIGGKVGEADVCTCKTGWILVRTDSEDSEGLVKNFSCLKE
ncbi:MAG: hypothetical protein PHV33_07470 [Elusimicrobiales bacterium]|nr:hypothetical protein [Elusimicrobiales bacterium]